MESLELTQSGYHRSANPRRADNGYDISDYQDIDPMFGSVEDMEALIKEAKKYNIRIIMDLVLNHTSNKHRGLRKQRRVRTTHIMITMCGEMGKKA